MSRRSLLNITSRKKHDAMAPYTNITATNPAAATFNISGAVMSGNDAGSPIVIPWMSTFWDYSANSNTPAYVVDEASRTAKACYMVGLKENIQVQTSNGIPWEWRRICFCAKGGGSINGVMPPASNTFSIMSETASGWTRTMSAIPASSQIVQLGNLLFRGSGGVDWTDIIVAPIDTSRIDLKYDKTRTITSGNEQGVSRRYNLWHPMRKTLVYDDDEYGGAQTFSYSSVLDKRGMGDYWVIDIFQPRKGSGGGSGVPAPTLTFAPNATLYWHER